jgi:peptidylprolyl isomerase
MKKLQQSKLTIALFFLTNSFFNFLPLSAQKIDSNVLEKKEIMKYSFYQGHVIYREYLEKSKIPFDLEQVVEGLKDAHKQEKAFVFDDESFRTEIKKIQTHILDEKSKQRLIDANLYLQKIALEPGIVELEKGKLYYRILQKGKGSQTVTEEMNPLIVYHARALENGSEEVVHQIDEPAEIYLASTIAGFIKGVVGMQEGEKRVLYIHPELAYGVTSGKVDPNTLMIFEIEILKANGISIIN